LETESHGHGGGVTLPTPPNKEYKERKRCCCCWEMLEAFSAIDGDKKQQEKRCNAHPVDF
jgi:hypothetical protein